MHLYKYFSCLIYSHLEYFVNHAYDILFYLCKD